MAIAFVQKASAARNQVGQTSFSVTINGVAAGNTLLLNFTWGNSNVETSVADDKSNTWTKDKGTSGTPGTCTVYRASNVASGNTVITGTVTANSICFVVGEYSGVLNSSPVDASVSAIGNSSSPDGGNITTAAGGELIFVGNLLNAGTGLTYSAGTSYTLRDSVEAGVNGVYAAVEDRIPVSGTYATNGTWSAAGDWAVTAVAYKVAPAVGGISTLPLLGVG